MLIITVGGVRTEYRMVNGLDMELEIWIGIWSSWVDVISGRLIWAVLYCDLYARDFVYLRGGSSGVWSRYIAGPTEALSRQVQSLVC